MRKTVVIHQPDFLPYLGFFDRLLDSDLYIVLDHVQYIKGGWQNRDKIKSPEGERWLTVPLQLKRKTFLPYNEVKITENDDWKNVHLNTLTRSYKDSPYFSEFFEIIEEIYLSRFSLMIDLNVKLLKKLMEVFDIEIETVLSSTLYPQGNSNQMLVDLLKKTNSTHYLSGVGARNYFIEKPFQDAGIKVVWQNFVHPVYPQLHGDFIPYLSCIDLLFNCGIENSRKILRKKL